MLMLGGTVYSPRSPVRGYQRRAGAVTVRHQDIPFRMPHAMEFGQTNLVHSHLRHSREERERFPCGSHSVHRATESYWSCPVLSDLRRTRGELERPPRYVPNAVESLPVA